MGDVERVELTARLRRVGCRIGVRIIDQSGADKLEVPARGPFHKGEREAFPDLAFELYPDHSHGDESNTCSLDELLLAFATQDTALLKRVLTGRNQAHLGEFLTRGLFGGWEEQCYLFSRVFHTSRQDRPSCLTGPVHLRIQATPGAEDLLMLPWRAMAWDGQPLRRTGIDWVFSVSTEQGWPQSNTLFRPCPILLMIPNRGRPASTNADLAPSGGEEHAKRLMELFDRLDEAFSTGDHIRCIRFAGDVEATLTELKPQVIYWYGHARIEEGELVQLLFDDEPLSLRTLADLIAKLSTRPELVYLNGCSTGVGNLLSGPRQLSPFVPVVIANHVRAHIATSRLFAVPFFHALFSEPPQHPAGALEHAASETGIDHDDWPWLAPMVWGQTGRWKTIFDRVKTRDVNRLLLKLDRRKQRDAAWSRLTDLLDGDLTAAHGFSLVYLGGRTDRVDGFADELQTHLAQKLGRRARLVPIRGVPALTARPTNYKSALRSMLAAALGATPDHIRRELTARAARATFGASHSAPPVVFWLDCGTYPAANRAALTSNDVEEWQAALVAELPGYLPENTIAVSLLGLEVPDPRSAHAAYENIFGHEDFLIGRMRVELLEPLGPVNFTDLMHLFDENAAALDLHGIERARAALAILGGKREARIPYDMAVNRIKDAVDMTWRIFLRRQGDGKP